MQSTGETIIEKLKKFLKKTDNITTIKQLDEFIARETGNTMFISQTLGELKMTGYYLFSYNYEQFSATVLLYVDRDSITKATENKEATFRVTSAVIVIN